jgi:hypothetical protein
MKQSPEDNDSEGEAAEKRAWGSRRVNEMGNDGEAPSTNDGEADEEFQKVFFGEE